MSPVHFHSLFCSLEMAHLSSYDSSNPETPETETDSTDVSIRIEKSSMILSTLYNNIQLRPSVRVHVQSRGATVQPLQPQPQPKTKAPREEDFETIKLISNGAYG